MKNLVLFTLVLVLLSCSAKKQIETAISHGNYDLAINRALNKLKHNPHKKRKQAFVVALKNAYTKVVEDDLKHIAQLKIDGNPEHFKTIYELYNDLEARQNAIKRVMPLQINGKTIVFKFKDYNQELVTYRYKTSEYLKTESELLLQTEDKFAARQAYGMLSYIHQINPNYKDVRQLMQTAHSKGTHHVFVSVSNQSYTIMPQALEASLLDIDAYGLNNFWTQYHTQFNNNVAYDFDVELQLQQINISPELVNQRQFLRKKEIVEGWEYLLDANGNVAKDSLGNDIKVDKLITIKARFFEVIQTKSAKILAKVVITDLKQNQVLHSFNLNSGFAFENVFGRFRGDRRALNAQDKALLRQEELYFPLDHQMLLDTSKDLKAKLKAALGGYAI